MFKLTQDKRTYQEVLSYRSKDDSKHVLERLKKKWKGKHAST